MHKIGSQTVNIFLKSRLNVSVVSLVHTLTGILHDERNPDTILMMKKQKKTYLAINIFFSFQMKDSGVS